MSTALPQGGLCPFIATILRPETQILILDIPAVAKPMCATIVIKLLSSAERVRFPFLRQPGGRDQRHAILALCSRAGVIIASLALATSVAAQAPGSTTTVFDGTYAGVSREYSWIANPTPGHNVKCGQNGVPFPLTITKGVVRSTPDFWEGSVGPHGTLVMRNGTRVLTAQIDNQGIIRGQRGGTDCATTWVWRKQSG